ncbi:MAG: sensor histidine kinase [Flavitalea sp.]
MSNSFAGKSDTLNVGNIQTYNSKPGFLSVMELTGNRDVSLNQAIAAFNDGKFELIKSAVFNPGIPENPYWFQFTLRNETNSPVDLMVEFANPRINRLLFYSINKSVQKFKGEQGDFFPFNQRNIEYKNFIFQSTLDPKEVKTYFVYCNQVGHVFSLPVKIYKRANFTKLNSRNYFTDGIAYGIFFFLALLTLIFFVSTLHYIYLYYSLYILVSIAWLLSYFGLGFQYIWPSFPSFNTVGAPLFASLNLILNMQICLVWLRLKEEKKSWNTIAKMSQVVMVILGIIPLLIDMNQFGYRENHLYLVTFLVSVILIVIFMIYLIAKFAFAGSFNARFYLIANVVKLPSLINLALFELGLSPGIHYMEGFLQAGLLLELGILTYTISQRYTLFKFRTFQQVMQAEEEQRNSISKELHDSISNTLTSIKYSLQSVAKNLNGDGAVKEQLHNISDKIGQVQVETRNISHNLMPGYIKNNSFIEILRLYIKSIQMEYHEKSTEVTIPIMHFSSNQEKVVMPDDTKLHLFRVMQEIINNIIRHSQATEADIVITAKRKELIIVVSDNGVGVDLNQARASSGNGLNNIFSRIELLSGKVEYLDTISSDERNDLRAFEEVMPNKGTTIVIKVPLGHVIHPKFHMYDY